MGWDGMGCSPGWGGSWHASFGCRAGFDHVTPLPAQVFSCPPTPQKKTILRWEKGTCSLPEQLGAGGEAVLGAAASLPRWLLVAKRETKSMQTKLDCLRFPCFHLLPHLCIHTFSFCWCCPSFSPFHSVTINGIFFFFSPIWATKFSPGQEQTEGRVLHFFPFHTITL